MLNSDVLPDKPGLDRRDEEEFYDATSGIGALGPKLLYEDDSLQHAGIYFSPLAGHLRMEQCTTSRACTGICQRPT